MNLVGILIERLLLEHFNRMNVVEASIHNHAGPSSNREADLSQLIRSVNYLLK